MASEKIKALSREFVDGTTFHGVKQTVTSTGALRKTLWLFFMAGTFTGLGIEIYNVVDTFKRSPVAINIQVEKLDRFPPITICPNRWMNETRLNEIGFDNETVEYLRGYQWFTNLLKKFENLKSEKNYA